MSFITQFNIDLDASHIQQGDSIYFTRKITELPLHMIQYQNHKWCAL